VTRRFAELEAESPEEIRLLLVVLEKEFAELSTTKNLGDWPG
jgi:hypothetical protein